MRFFVKTHLDIPTSYEWAAVNRPVTLLYVTRGFLGFSGGDRMPLDWYEGKGLSKPVTGSMQIFSTGIGKRFGTDWPLSNGTGINHETDQPFSEHAERVLTALSRWLGQSCLQATLRAL